MVDNFRFHRTNTPRILEERWESHKSVLLDKCQTMTFADLASYMNRVHNFPANRRQLGHRIRKTWGFKKYKRGGSPETSLLEAQALCGGGSRRGTVPTNGAAVAGDAASRDPCPPPVVAGRDLLDVPPPVTRPPATLATPDLAAVQFSFSEAKPADVKTRYLWLADILVGFRDSRHAFDINEALWKETPSSKHTLACIGTAQYAIQLIVNAREMARHDAEPSLRDARSQSWVPTFMDLLNAHTYEWGHGMENGLGQITRIFNGIIEKTIVHDIVQYSLVELTPRDINLDIPAYTLFRSALEWYNRENPATPIDTPPLLTQFIVQHLSAIRGPEQIGTALDLDINCLPSCIRWCSAILGSNPHIPPEVCGADGDIPIETFAVLCVLWRPLLGSNLPSNRVVTRSSATPFPDWATTTEKQLGIRPPQLLCTVVCMIMAAAIEQQNMLAEQSLWGRALAGANSLSALTSQDLLSRFLNQTCADNWRLKAQTDADRGFPIYRYEVDTQKMEPFRGFVATSLGIYDLPMLEQGVIFHELALAGSEFPEECY
ncbi:hypothetical protein F5144DRAFT_603321 [Chaetomium tenue]|uniref:Uncharacterized protein n=1 Tax=Chaetomium tenue TaxID=1854479 RepID=A0ACB7P8E4_9PEZI|nr:hypothetical protein F5144DRAFT_603321 [Chaetomium globosum]